MSGAAITYLVERMIASGHFLRESDPDRPQEGHPAGRRRRTDRRAQLLHTAGRTQSARDGGVTRPGPRRRAPNLLRGHRRDACLPDSARRVVTSSTSSHGCRQVRLSVASSRSSPCSTDLSTSSSMCPLSRSAMNASRSAASISSRSRRNAAVGLSPISSALRPSRSHAELRRRVFHARKTSAARSASVGLGFREQFVEPVGRGDRRLLLCGGRGDRVGAGLIALNSEPPDEQRQRQAMQQQCADHDDEREEHDVAAAGELARPTASSAAPRTPRPARPHRAFPPTRR